MADKLKVELEIPKGLVEAEGSEFEMHEKTRGNLRSLNTISGKTKNLKGPQIKSLAIGLVLIVVSLILWPIFGFSVAIAAALAGIILVAIGTFVKL